MKLEYVLESLSIFLCSAATVHASNTFSRDETATKSINSSNSEQTEVYDYIVVGSGPGGGPLASRLAIAGFKVLLIDAGNDQGTSYQEEVPTLWPLSTQYAPMQWNYFINHFPTIDRQEQDSKFTWQTPSGDYFSGPDPPVGSKPLGVLYPRAGTLGGCATHNAMVSLYAHDSDWDYIANLTGDSSWAPDNMRIYFEKLERNEYLPHHASGHGRNGWLGTSVLDESILVKDSKIMCHAAAAARVINNHTVGATPSTVKELQKIMLPDSNKPGQTDKQGFYELPLAVSDGKRSSPRDFVLSTANAVNADGSRKYHLDVRLNTFVTKINFDQGISPPRATGVEYLDGVGLYSTTPKSVAGTSTGSGCFEASREVIISAGSFNTPQLLKLSGVGSRAELESFGIPVVADLPGVGSNLQDRYETTVVTKTDSTFEILDGCSLLTEDPDLCLEKWENGTTPAQKGFYAGNAFPLAVIKKSSVAVLDPDVFLFGGPVFFRGFYPGWANVTELLPSTAKGWWTWFILKAHGRNHAGTVTLRSTNPLDTPIINFNSFDTGTTTDGADEKDLQAFYEGVQFARQVNNELNCDGCAFEEVFPGPNFTTEADAKNFIKHEAFGHHASCTAAIGSDDDPNAVLDSSFRVRNVTGLRVVDASSFPLTPGMFIAVPIYMISEKAADVIIKDASQ